MNAGFDPKTKRLEEHWSKPIICETGIEVIYHKNKNKSARVLRTNLLTSAPKRETLEFFSKKWRKGKNERMKIKQAKLVL